MKTFIVAGNYAQFKYYCHRNGLNVNDARSVIYVTKHNIRGMSINDEDEVLAVGTCYARKDIDELTLSLQVACAKSGKSLEIKSV